MRTIIAGLALGLVATAAFAQTQQAAFFALRGKGAAGWTAHCTLQRVDGRTLERDIEGRRDRLEVIASRSIVSGRCEYQATAEGPVELSFDDSRFACPFPSTGDVCVRRIEAGESGRFDVRMKP
ncbi:hypothetical protein [uncultured Brevundimonas sp.]|uniref:hypothetical protein n=1 Tax=uncultured Brevundimonas sp. TaxID=213418 RepID=UPI002613CFA7|nr:hypothetical protein [uncultured Brevundimonas sp.]